MTQEDKKELIIKREEYGTSLVDMSDVHTAKNTMQAIVRHDVIRPQDKQFFLDNMERWNDVSTKTHIWRTFSEKKSILSELPTTHLRFHQAILENKVFYEQTLLLDKEAKMTKLEAEELYVDIENLQDNIKELQENLENTIEDSKEYRQLNYQIRKKDIELRKKLTELHEKAMAIKNQENQMLYRIDELRDWKRMEDSMIEEMKSQGMTEEEIYNKNKSQESGNFFLFLTKYSAVKQSKDTGEINNLTYLAQFYVDESIKDNKFEDYLRMCNRIQIQSLLELGYIQAKEKEDKSGFEILIPEELKKRP
jgi:hypothetical protein